jgi:dual specificity MAP kinase phosphatase
MASYSKKLDHIKHGIYLSNWESSVDEKILTQNNIKAVICVNNIIKRPSELKVYERLNIQHYQIDAEDSENVDLRQWFARTNKIIEHYVSRNQCVLVHCTAGISRSVTIVLAYFIYLTHCRGVVRPNKVVIHHLYKWICSKRKCALPNPGFYSQLMDYEKEYLTI